jgi:hypothetical protein
VLQDPNRPDFQVQPPCRPAEVSLERLGRRRDLLEQVGRPFKLYRGMAIGSLFA